MTFPDPFEYEYAHAWVLWLLALVPLLALYEFWPRRRQHSTFSFSGLTLLKKSGRGWRVYLEPLPAVLRLFALALLLLALARPHSDHAESQQVDEGIDIFVALDMSGSMEAVDMSSWEVRESLNAGKYPKNRFQVAVDVLRRFVKERPHDRLGMVVFGVDAYLEFPLTLDKSTILNILSRRALGDIERNGTAIGDAIARSVASLRRSEAESKIVVLITDGDNRGGKFLPRTAAGFARDKGIKVFPILIGREDGLPPVVPNDEHWSSHRPVEFLTNPQLLKELATMTGGHYSRAGSEAELHDILKSLPTSKITSSQWSWREDYFFHYLGWALLFLALGMGARYSIIRKFP